MKILITNDDGIKAEGLRLLVDFLKEIYIHKEDEIWVVAPFSEMSAVSQKLTLREGLDIKKEENLFEGVKAYSVTGTPTDCIKVAICFLNYTPDIVFSGINKGYNIGNDILYSGTISAVFEASLKNIKGIAISCSNKTFEGTAYLGTIFSYLEEHQFFPLAKIININIPISPNHICITRQGRLPFVSYYEQKKDGLYYLQGHPDLTDGLIDVDLDVYAINHQQVSISFLTPNRTDEEVFRIYKKN